MGFNVFPLPQDGESLRVATEHELAGQEEVRAHLAQTLSDETGGELFAQGKVRQGLTAQMRKATRKQIKSVSDMREAFRQEMQNATGRELSQQVATRLVAGGLLADAAHSPVSGTRAPPARTSRFTPRAPITGILPQGNLKPGQLPPHVPPVTVPLGTGTVQSISPYCTAIGWYVTWQPPNGCFTVPCDIVGSLIGGVVLAGPFATADEAVAWETAHGCGPHKPPPIPLPPPVIQPPPPPPPIPSSGVSVSGYYCVTDQSGATSVMWLTPDGGPPEGEVVTAGPFVSADEAQTACLPPSGGDGQCPPPTDCPPCQPPPTQPPPADQPPAPPAPACQIINFGDFQIPPIGSPEFCASLEVVIEVITNAGNALVQWLQSVNQWTQEFITWLQTASPGDITGFKVIDVAINWLAKVLGTQIQIEMEILTQVITCWTDIASRMPGCNPTSVVAVALVRSLIRSLEKIRAGVNADLWLTIDITVSVPQWDRLSEYILEYLCPSKIPDVGDAMSALMQGQIGPQVYACWVKAHGASPEVYNPVLMARSNTVSRDDLIRIGRRYQWSDDDISNVLEAHGWVRDEDRAYAQVIYNRVPETGQVIAWARNNLFDDALAERWGLDTGFDDFWAADPGGWLFEHGEQRQIANIAYRATWHQMTIGDAREYLYRIRSDNVGDGAAFTEQDWSDALAFANLTDKEIAFRTATRYRPLSVADVGNMVVWGIAGHQRITAAYLDAGISPSEVDALATLERQRAVRETAQVTQGWTLSRVVPLIRIGMLTLDQAMGLLEGQGYADQDVARAVAANIAEYKRRQVERGAMRARMALQRAATSSYALGSITADQASAMLSSVGYDDASIMTVLWSADLQSQQKVMQTLVNALRSEFLLGTVSQGQAENYLRSAGIAEPRISEYIGIWSLQKTTKRKILSAGQIGKFLKEGLLSSGEASDMLRNLGWEYPERQLILHDIALAIAAAEQKQELAAEKAAEKKHREELAAEARTQAAAARQQKQLAAAAAQAMRDLKAKEKELIAAMAKSYPKSLLKDRLLAGWITEAYVRHVLRMENYTDQAIDLLIAEWTKEKLNGAPLSSPETPATG